MGQPAPEAFLGGTVQSLSPVDHAPVSDGWLSSGPVEVGAAPPSRPVHSVSGPARLAMRPDTVLDAWREPEVAMLAASTRGEGHRRSGAPRQDDCAVLYDAQLRRVIIAVADGVSSASHAHAAATSACRYTAQWIDQQCRETPAAEIPWSTLIGSAAHQVRAVAEQILGDAADGASAVADTAGGDTDADRLERLNQLASVSATTLSVVVMDVFESDDGPVLRGSAACVGDSSVVRLSEQGFEYLGAGKDEDEAGLSSSQVYPLPFYSPSAIEEFPVDVYADEFLLVGSDGVWDALGAGTGALGNAIATAVRRPHPSITEFGHVVDFVKDSFDDDRTLVAVWLPGQGQP